MKSWTANLKVLASGNCTTQTGLGYQLADHRAPALSRVYLLFEQGSTQMASYKPVLKGKKMKANKKCTGRIRVKVEHTLGKKLFPFPGTQVWHYGQYSFGQNYDKAPDGDGIQRSATSHFNKKEAIRVLNYFILRECNDIVITLSTKINQMHFKLNKITPVLPSQVKEVIWRFAAYGKQARNFLFLDDRDRLWLLLKIGNRYRFIPAADNWDTAAASIPEEMFTRAVEAYYLWKETGQHTWWHEEQGPASPCYKKPIRTAIKRHYRVRYEAKQRRYRIRKNRPAL